MIKEEPQPQRFPFPGDPNSTLVPIPRPHRAQSHEHCRTLRLPASAIIRSHSIQRFHSTQNSPKMNAKAYVDGIVNSTKVAMFVRSDCPLCYRARVLFQRFPLVADALAWIELDKRSDGDRIGDYLAEITGRKTVPRVFVGGEFLGDGRGTVEAMKSGALLEKLTSIGALQPKEEIQICPETDF